MGVRAVEMGVRSTILWLVCAVLGYANTARAAEADLGVVVELKQRYQISPGDEVQISVYGEPDMATAAKVPESGIVKVPFVGDIEFIGKTAVDLEDLIAAALADGYLVDPKVTVTVESYRPVYVNGEVRSAGGFPFRPGLTIRKAITLAGGLTERASKRKIFVVSEASGNAGQPRRAKLDDELRPGDIVTIEQSFF